MPRKPQAQTPKREKADQFGARISLLSLCALAVVAVLVLSGCPDDDEKWEWPTLMGRYTGTLTITDRDGMPVVLDTTLPISLRFGSSDFELQLDTTVADSARVFCDCRGVYSIGTGVTLDLDDAYDTCV